MKKFKILTFSTIATIAILSLLSVSAVMAQNTSYQYGSGYLSGWIIPSVQPVWTENKIERTIKEWDDLVIQYGKMLKNHTEVAEQNRAMKEVRRDGYPWLLPKNIATLLCDYGYCSGSYENYIEGDDDFTDTFTQSKDGIINYSFSGAVSTGTGTGGISLGALTDSYIYVSPTLTPGEHKFMLDMCTQWAMDVWGRGMPDFPA